MQLWQHLGLSYVADSNNLRVVVQTIVRFAIIAISLLFYESSTPIVYCKYCKFS